MAKCNQPCDVYSRVVGYYRPTRDWYVGKKSEFEDRLTYKVEMIPLTELDVKVCNLDKDKEDN